MLNIDLRNPAVIGYRYSVVGNNNVDVVCFISSFVQYATGYKVFVKVEDDERTYVDKIEIASEDITVEEDTLKVQWTMGEVSTQCKRINVQLQFENNDGTLIDQSLIAKITLADSINVDEEASHIYPKVLEDLQEQIDNRLKIVDYLEGTTVAEMYAFTKGKRFITTGGEICEISTSDNTYTITVWEKTGYGSVENVPAYGQFDSYIHDAIEYQEYLTGSRGTQLYQHVIVDPYDNSITLICDRAEPYNLSVESDMYEFAEMLVKWGGSVYINDEDITVRVLCATTDTHDLVVNYMDATSSGDTYSYQLPSQDQDYVTPL